MIGIDEKELQLVNELEFGGVYEHYKSTTQKTRNYRLLGIVRHTENDQLMVIYEALYDCGDHGQMWARPLSMFVGTVEISGQHIPRFRLVAEADCDTKSCC